MTLSSASVLFQKIPPIDFFDKMCYNKPSRILIFILIGELYEYYH